MDLRRAIRDYFDSAAPAVALYRAGKPAEAWQLYLSNGGVTGGEAPDASLASAKKPMKRARADADSESRPFERGSAARCRRFAPNRMCIVMRNAGRRSDVSICLAVQRSW